MHFNQNSQNSNVYKGYQLWRLPVNNVEIFFLTVWFPKLSVSIHSNTSINCTTSRFFNFTASNAINVRAILMLSDRQLTNAIKVRGINRKSRQLMMDGGENVITVWPAYNGRSKLRPDRTEGVRSDGSPHLSGCNYRISKGEVSTNLLLIYWSTIFVGLKYCLSCFRIPQSQTNTVSRLMNRGSVKVLNDFKLFPNKFG